MKISKITNWKKSFRHDVDNKWHLMNKEFSDYQTSNNVGYLQQAGNKLFSVVENYLQVKYNKQVKSYSELKFLVRSNKNDTELLVESNQLHRFFYNGEVQMTRDDAEYFFLKNREKMRNRLK